MLTTTNQENRTLMPKSSHWIIAVVAQAYRSRHDQNPDENNE